MDDRPIWERVLDGSTGDVDLHGDIVIRRIPSELQALLDRIPVRNAEPNSAADRHVQETGHSLRFGCCSVAP